MRSIFQITLAKSPIKEIFYTMNKNFFDFIVIGLVHVVTGLELLMSTAVNSSSPMTTWTS